ncbi:kinase-like protein [Hesseltinella vesiculosa]|uniref:Kinase-like protein n=1 Tax=Hesseltinella vesiculosa TaxID=101127 RepID=A0A1X2GDF0_9FUNG|nr:kinase-like protein [Hesseltinella vesiculosa]
MGVELTNEDRVKEYLGDLFDPKLIKDIKRLTGGFANFVWRVELLTPLEMLDNQNVMIIKYAPPYVAAWPEMKFDPNRMKFEVAVMKRAIDPDISLAGITVPKVYRFDKDNKIMFMEYFDRSIDLKQYVLTLKTPLQPDLASIIGNRLGKFLARLHLAGKCVDRQALFDGQDNNHTALVMSKATVYGQLNDRLEKRDQEDAIVITIKKAAEWAGNELMTQPVTLCMGDYWTTNVLIATDAEPATCRLGVIDWELSRFAPPAFDLAQMLGEIYFLLRYRQASDALLTTFLASYQELRPLEIKQLKIMLIHIGLHLIVWAVYAGWVPKEDQKGAEEIYAIGAAYVQHAWIEDWTWFQNTPFQHIVQKVIA